MSANPHTTRSWGLSTPHALNSSSIRARVIHAVDPSDTFLGYSTWLYLSLSAHMPCTHHVPVHGCITLYFNNYCCCAVLRLYFHGRKCSGRAHAHMN